MGAILIPSAQRQCSLGDYFGTRQRVYINFGISNYNLGSLSFTTTNSGVMLHKGNRFRGDRRCYWFDGNNDHVDCANASLFPYGGAGFTFLAWVYPDNTTGEGRIIEEAHGGSSTYNAVVWNGDGKYKCTSYGSTVGWQALITPTVGEYKVGQWTLVGQTYDHLGWHHTQYQTRLYVNGCVRAAGVNNRATGFGGNFNTWIGGNANNAGTIYQWAGRIAELMVLDKPLTDAIMFDVYRATSQPSHKMFYAGMDDVAPPGGGIFMPPYYTQLLAGGGAR